MDRPSIPKGMDHLVILSKPFLFGFRGRANEQGLFSWLQDNEQTSKCEVARRPLKALRFPLLAEVNRFPGPLAGWSAFEPIAQTRKVYFSPG